MYVRIHMYVRMYGKQAHTYVYTHVHMYGKHVRTYIQCMGDRYVYVHIYVGMGNR